MAKELRIYRPKKSGDGSATKFEFKFRNNDKNIPELLVFWVATAQTGVDANGNDVFAWKDAGRTITMKLDENDMGDILALLNGRKKELQRFHQNKHGNTVLRIVRTTSKNNDEAIYMIKISQKKNDNLLTIEHAMNLGEAEILRSLLDEAIRQMYEW